jgi:hypothetical protein
MIVSIFQYSFFIFHFSFSGNYGVSLCISRWAGETDGEYVYIKYINMYVYIYILEYFIEGSCRLEGISSGC